MATITKAHKGATYRHREGGEKVTVDSVFRNPTNGFAGNRISPFASVVGDWGREFIPLSELEDDEVWELVTE